MPSCRPMSGARSRRLLWGLAVLALVGGNPRMEGDDSPAGNEGVRVEVNSAPRKKTRDVEIDLGESKDVSRAANRVRKKNFIAIDLGDSKDATVEIVRESRGANVEINGYRVRPRWRPRHRYLFGQAQILEPSLPPSQFNPDPGGGNLLEPIEPPDLYPPILPQPPEYDGGAAPRSLGLPRRGVREMTPERHKLDYQEYPDSESGRGLLPGSEPVSNRWFIGFGRWQRYSDPTTETPY